VRPLGIGADRPRLAACADLADLEQVQALVGPVGEDEPFAVEHGPGSAAVLVHPVADVPRRGQDLDRPAVGSLAEQGDAPVLGRSALGPPHTAAVHADPIGLPVRFGDEAGAQR
jgi:hypothetical protein